MYNEILGIHIHILHIFFFFELQFIKINCEKNKPMVC